MNEIRYISVFSGIGGLDRGLRLAGGFRTVCYIEIEPYFQEALRSRQLDGTLDMAPIWDDAAKFDGRPWSGRVEMVAGGFPCQDVSEAGQKAGLDGARSGLWREMARIIREVGPRLVLVENVTGLFDRGFGDVLGDLASLGYDAEWSPVSACSMGASHMRSRVFIVAHPWGVRRGARRQEEPGKAWRTALGKASFHDERRGRWQTLPAVRRSSDGVPNRMERLRGLGNAIVPQVAEWIGRRIMKVESREG